MTPRVRLIVSAVLFVGWMGWLGYTALTKSRAPVVSRAQAAAASVPVLAELVDGKEDFYVHLVRRQGLPGQEVKEAREKGDRPAVLVTVVESLKGGPAAGAKIAVHNLPQSGGYTGPGRYLLLLNKEDAGHVLVGAERYDAYTLVGQQRSPGAELADAGAPLIYPWSQQTDTDLRKQVQRLFP